MSLYIPTYTKDCTKEEVSRLTYCTWFRCRIRRSAGRCIRPPDLLGRSNGHTRDDRTEAGASITTCGNRFSIDDCVEQFVQGSRLLTNCSSGVGGALAASVSADCRARDDMPNANSRSGVKLRQALADGRSLVGSESHCHVAGIVALVRGSVDIPQVFSSWPAVSTYSCSGAGLSSGVSFEPIEDHPREGVPSVAAVSVTDCSMSPRTKGLANEPIW